MQYDGNQCASVNLFYDDLPTICASVCAVVSISLGIVVCRELQLQVQLRQSVLHVTQSTRIVVSGIKSKYLLRRRRE